MKNSLYLKYSSEMEKWLKITFIFNFLTPYNVLP